MSLLKMFTNLLTGSSSSANRHPVRKMTERDIIQMESDLGRDIFGPVPSGGRREFFCLDERTWIWHEEWIDEAKTARTRTTRYEMHDNGILKIQEGSKYQFIEGEELRNFAVAVEMYYERVMKNVYGRDPQTGQPLGAIPATMGIDAR